MFKLKKTKIPQPNLLGTFFNPGDTIYLITKINDEKILQLHYAENNKISSLDWGLNIKDFYKYIEEGHYKLINKYDNVTNKELIDMYVNIQNKIKNEER